MEAQMQENQDVKSKKDLFFERLKAQNPELDTDDEESLYATIGDNYDNFEQYRSERDNVDKMLSDRFNSDSKFGSFFLKAIQEGANPIAAFLEVYPDEVQAFLDDPENADALNQAQQANLEKIAKSEELERTYSANLEQSFTLLDQFQTENGITDEQADEIFTSLIADAENIIMGTFTTDMFSAKMKSLNYDKDIETTKHDAYVEGKNENIKDVKKATQLNAGVPPMITGKRGMNRERTDAAEQLQKSVNDKYDMFKDAKRITRRR